jgi:transcriptional regulator with XRE-family HTH domain
MAVGLAAGGGAMSGTHYGQQVRAARKQSGLAQNRLAALVGITKAYMCDLELGRRTPSRQVAARIEAAVGVGWDASPAQLRERVAELEALVVAQQVQIQRLVAQHGAFPNLGYESQLKGL